MSFERNQKGKFLLSIVGPTAIGKTAVSINLAKDLETVIISADSRQFFKEMKIGTAKPTPEELSEIRHYFIDSLSIHDEYNAGMFETEALGLLQKLYKEKDIIIMAGGSGLYCKAVWEGFDEMPVVDPEVREKLNAELHQKGLKKLVLELEDRDPEYFKKVDKNNPQRIVRALEIIRSTGKKYTYFRNRKTSNPRFFKTLKAGLELDREVVYKRIDDRMDQMIDQGLFEEAKRLYPFKAFNALQTVGYTEIFDYLDGKYDYHEAVRLLKRNSRRYAKRQLTWFKRDPDITWFRPDEYERIKAWVADNLNT